MEKLILITDLHVTSTDDLIIGLDPIARLKSVLNHAQAHHGDADAIILLGDLTHHGRIDQYERLGAVLNPIPTPLIPMVGNHDRRDRFRAAFPKAPDDGDGFVQSILDFPQHRIITLDTLMGPPYPAGQHIGELCEKRMAWLENALSGAEGRMPLVFMHHPPFSTGIVGMDRIQLRDGDAVLALLAKYKAAHLFCGHIHRTISGTTASVPWTMLKSPCHQGVLDMVNPDSSLSIDEPAGYGIALLTDHGVVCHHQDVGFDQDIRRDGHST